MTSFGGGWTMCYTADSHVNIMTELSTTDALGYRADCNNIPVRYIQYILLCLHIGICKHRYLICMLFRLIFPEIMINLSMCYYKLNKHIKLNKNRHFMTIRRINSVFYMRKTL